MQLNVARGMIPDASQTEHTLARLPLHLSRQTIGFPLYYRHVFAATGAKALDEAKVDEGRASPGGCRGPDGVFVEVRVALEGAVGGERVCAAGRRGARGGAGRGRGCRVEAQRKGRRY